MTAKKQSPTIEELQEKIYELEKQHNTYSEVVDSFVDGFVLELTSNVKQIKLETLQQWFSNPDTYIEEISNLLTYCYIVDGNIFQLYDLIFSLPKLDYKITPYERTKTYEKDMIKIRQALEKKVGYKRLTRDLLVQEAHEGTVIGTWLGGATDPYFHIFSDLKHVFPYGMYRGKMRAVIDLKMLDEMKPIERNALYDNLKPLITEAKYNKWKNENNKDKKDELQYILLPEDKTLVARTHTLYRTQRYGMPHGTQSMFDLIHKQKMKELEQSIADKVIRAMAVLKFKGKDDNDNKVSDTAKNKVFQSVKKALEKSSKSKNGTVSVIALPDFSDLEFADFKGIDDALDPKKYTSTNDDISNSIGISKVLTNGTTGNFASAKLNLEMFYQRIAVMLEDIEEIFNQLIVIILGEKKGCNYRFEFNKEMPLSKKERTDILLKLQANGYSVKYVLDELGINTEDYINQSIYEIEELGLRNKIIPPLSTYTMTDNTESDVYGSPTNDNPTNDNTIVSKENDANSSPKANI